MPGHPLEHINVTVGQRMRQRRLELGLSQQALAAELGLVFQQVQKYERGANRMTIDRLVQVAQILGKPVTWFFDEPEMPTSDDARNDRLLLQVTQTWPRLSRKTRVAVARLVKTMTTADAGNATSEGPDQWSRRESGSRKRSIAGKRSKYAVEPSPERCKSARTTRNTAS